MAVCLRTVFARFPNKISTRISPCAVSGPVRLQVRWSSATTEPHQPDAEGTLKGEPSSQKYLKFTSESYVNELWCQLKLLSCVSDRYPNLKRDGRFATVTNLLQIIVSHHTDRAFLSSLQSMLNISKIY